MLNSSESLSQNFEEHLQHFAKTWFKSSVLDDAILYSLLAPGKRLRPLLVLTTSEIMSGNKQVALTLATAVEMIHCYSLIHDDLPAMDNDDFRRGIKTNHKVYGEAIAILSGDALLNLSNEYLLTELSRLKVPSEQIIKMLQVLFRASGKEGMILGQALDMSKLAPSLDNLEKIHRHKTGALIEAACLLGLQSSLDLNLIKNEEAFVLNFSQKLGLTFQLIDDIIDEKKEFNELGKTPKKDLAQGKLTYPALLGLKEAEALAHKNIAELKNLSSRKIKGSLWLPLIENMSSKLKD